MKQLFANSVHGVTTNNARHVSPFAKRVLDRAGLELPATGKTIPLNVLDAAMKNWPVADRAFAKTLLFNSGLIKR
jgi:hypothetical protein